MAILIVIASFSSIILSKLKFPSLVGFLVAGILIANYIKLPEGSGDVISIFSNLGLIMLMFAIGLEIDITKLKIEGRFAIVIAIIQIPVMLITGMIAGSLMGYGSVQSITLGAILSGASTAVVLAVLKTNKVLPREKMDILILVMIIEDISQVIMISILTPMMGGASMSTDALIVLILRIAVFMIVCFTLGLKIVPRVIDWIYGRSSNDELICLLCIGLLFVFALLANIVGLSVAIGAFLTGVMVGMSRPKHTVENFIDPLKSLFMAMFFISVGMEVSIDSLLNNIPMILVIYAIFAVCMFIAVNIGYWVANGDSRSGWISATAMCTMGEFAFIISKQALDYGLFDRSFYSSIIGAAIVSMVILPMLVRSSSKTYDAMTKVSPAPLKRFGAFMSKERNLMYDGLAVASHKSKERFSKGLTNSAFLVVIILIIEIIFFLIYTPLSQWLTKNIGSTEEIWRIAILFVNIIVLLEPCRRLAKFLRLVLSIIETGRDTIDKEEFSYDSPKARDYFSTLAVGAAITFFIVLIVPNGIADLVHVAVLVPALLLMIAFQVYKYEKGKLKEGPAPAVSEENADETFEDQAEDRPETEAKEEEQQ